MKTEDKVYSITEIRKFLKYLQNLKNSCRYLKIEENYNFYKNNQLMEIINELCCIEVKLKYFERLIAQTPKFKEFYKFMQRSNNDILSFYKNHDLDYKKVLEEEVYYVIQHLLAYEKRDQKKDEE